MKFSNKYKVTRRIFVLAAMLACFTEPATADEAKEGYTVVQDVRYGDLARNVLDVYRPVTTSIETPVVVYFYGGGLRQGSKGSARGLGQSLAANGMITVAPDYGLYPDVTYPEIGWDCAAAVAWAWKELRNDAGEARPIFLVGHSAGAFNALTVGTDNRYLDEFGVPRGAVTGIVSLAAPYLGWVEKNSFIFPELETGQEPLLMALDANDPPMLIIHGEKDEMTPVSVMEEYASAARDAGIPVTTVTPVNRYHTHVKWDLAKPGTETRIAFDQFVLDRTMRE